MKLSQKSQSLMEIIAPAVAACAVDLWGIEFYQQGKKSMLRIFIDKPSAPSPVSADEQDGDVAQDDSGYGVGAEDCANVSRQVGAVLDVHDPISGEYTLEVSSPGWDRPFFTIEQMIPFMGQTIAIRLISPVENRRKATGVLVSIENKMLTLQVDNQPFVVETDNVDKANLVYQD